MADHHLDGDALYHLATEAEWVRYQQSGVITPASLETEGFVHCSWGRQVAGTVAKHFVGVTDLLALTIDRAALGGVDLVEEDLYGSGQAFPHAYGAIPVVAITATTPVVIG